jgi:hypothetical protein
MQQKITRAILLVLLLSAFLNSASAQANTCAGYPPSRLEGWGFAQVTPGDSNRVRSAPTTSAEQVGEIPALAIMNVLSNFNTPDGVCADGYLWREVAYNGVVGWTVEATEGGEYWLLPFVERAPESIGIVEDEVVRVSDGNIGFRFPVSLASNAAYQFRVGYMVPEAMSPHPNRHSYFLTDYAGGSGSAIIELYAVNSYRALAGGALPTVERLRELLDERPDLLALGREERLPRLPSIPAAQVIRAQGRYLDFAGGAGIGYIALYVQNTVPLDGSTGFMYLFQGLTDDGETLISAEFPLIVPTDDFPLFDDAAQEAQIESQNRPETDYWLTYTQGVMATLNGQPSSAFTPDLAVLDGLLGSIVVE